MNVGFNKYFRKFLEVFDSGTVEGLEIEISGESPKRYRVTKIGYVAPWEGASYLLPKVTFERDIPGSGQNGWFIRETDSCMGQIRGCSKRKGVLGPILVLHVESPYI